MRFAIRDDDTCYFTQPEDLERIYSRLPDCAVSLAVTPFALKSEHLGDPSQFIQSGPPMPLHKNRELVAYLSQAISEDRYSILCHGFTHEYERRGADLVQECLWKDPERLRVEAAFGKSYLEQVLETTVDTYVPPGNSIAKTGIAAIGNAFKNILATLPLRRASEFLFDASDRAALTRRLADQIRLGGPGPHGYKVRGAHLLPCTSWTAVADWRLTCARLEQARRMQTDFTVAVHYWELKGRVLDGLLRLADQALALGFETAHCSEMFLGYGQNTCSEASGRQAAAGKDRQWADSKIL